MILFLAFLSLFSINDTLSQHCHCPIPQQIKPLEANADSLWKLDKQNKYQEGFTLALRYLKSDSTNKKLYYWLSKFSFTRAEQATGNPTYRQKKYKDSNPYVKYKVIQDTVGFLYYRGLKNYGPRPWPKMYRNQYGRYALCASRCIVSLYPQKKKFFSRYLNTLIAMQKIEELIKVAEGKMFEFPTLKKKNKLGEYLLSFSNQFIGFKAYKAGLKYAQAVLQNHTVSERIQKRWNELFHKAIREDPTIPSSEKPHIHEKVENYIPEIEE